MVRRTDAEWMDGLSGSLGEGEQKRAHDELGKYLHRVVFNYLLQRQSDLSALGKFSGDDLGEMAQDFVQETLEKIARNNFSLLNSFAGRGSFTSWVAQIAVNQARQELRRSYWTRQSVLNQEEGGDAQSSPPSLERLLISSERGPESTAIYNAIIHRIARLLQCCLDGMQRERCIAYWRCEIEERSGQDAAKELGISTAAVFMHVFRAKRTLRRCLEEAGLDRTILNVFDH